MSEVDSTELSDFFKLFSDKTRVDILICLMEKNECCVEEISKTTGMEQSAISHQLRVLRQGRIIKNRKEGKYSFYSLDDEHVATIILMGKAHIQEQKN